MYSRCLDLFFCCHKSKKSNQSKKPLLAQQAKPAQEELELISREIAIDVQAYLAQLAAAGDTSKAAAYLLKKKTLPQLAAELRSKYKLYEQKYLELSHFSQENFPEYQRMEAAVQQAKVVCCQAEADLLEAMHNHKKYLDNFDDSEDLQVVLPQMKF